jgi:hypothetical protein
MDKIRIVKRLKERLRTRVSEMVEGHVTGAEQLRPLFDYFLKENLDAYFFGGMLRNFCLSSNFEPPRDVDIVIEQEVDKIAEHFASNLIRRNSFGGLKLAFGNHQVDLWQLDKTWAFKQRFVSPVDIKRLPETTFLNVDALAIDVFPCHSKDSRRAKSLRIFESGFFEASISGILEINLENNPYPELCVVRALTIAKSTGFSIGPRLNEYMIHQLHSLRPDLFERIQHKHYGKLKSTQKDLLWLKEVLSRSYNLDPRASVSLFFEQIMFPDSFDLKEINRQGGGTLSKEIQLPNTEMESSLIERYVSMLLLNETSYF